MLIWGCMASMLWMTFSCEEYCEEPNRTAVAVNFYSYETEALLTEQKDSIWAIRGIVKDSLIYPPDLKSNPNFEIRKTRHSQVLLPVNPSADMMRFSIKRDTFPPDTITIRYTRRNGFVSSECGCVTYAEIQGEPERTEYAIKRMDVVNPNVTTVSYRQGVINAENIRIYY